MFSLFGCGFGSNRAEPNIFPVFPARRELCGGGCCPVKSMFPSAPRAGRNAPRRTAAGGRGGHSVLLCALGWGQHPGVGDTMGDSGTAQPSCDATSCHAHCSHVLEPCPGLVAPWDGDDGGVTWGGRGWLCPTCSSTGLRAAPHQAVNPAARRRAPGIGVRVPRYRPGMEEAAGGCPRCPWCPRGSPGVQRGGSGRCLWAGLGPPGSRLAAPRCFYDGALWAPNGGHARPLYGPGSDKAAANCGGTN